MKSFNSGYSDLLSAKALAVKWAQIYLCQHWKNCSVMGTRKSLQDVALEDFLCEICRAVLNGAPLAPPERCI